MTIYNNNFARQNTCRTFFLVLQNALKSKLRYFAKNILVITIIWMKRLIDHKKIIKLKLYNYACRPEPWFK